jgi:flagellar hook-associated protein 3 FlgL
LRSNAEDLDLLSAYPEFQQLNTNYEAALKTYSMVQKLSIFNYIGG